MKLSANFKIRNIFIGTICLLLIGTTIYPKEKKKTINLKDMELWRTHSIKLSENGEWYTVLYKFIEKKIDKKSSVNKRDKAKKKRSQKSRKNNNSYFYGKAAETDTLYIRNRLDGKEYKIPRGEKPAFSQSSQWVAYYVKPAKKGKKNLKTIELKNLKTGKTRHWKSKGKFSFPQKRNYFISYTKDSLLIFNLDTQKEQYIGNIGTHLIDKKSPSIIYTIKTKNMVGNGVYTYNPSTSTTRSLDTGNFEYSNLALSPDKSCVAAIKFVPVKKGDPKDIRLLTVRDIGSNTPLVKEYKSKEIKGIPKNMRLSTRKPPGYKKNSWSRDKKRLIVNIVEKTVKEPVKKGAHKKKPTVDIWHWKDEKLVSQQMKESLKPKQLYVGIFTFDTNTLTPLTDKEMQKIYFSTGTDRWGVGTDNRKWISDWDIEWKDLYRIDLITGKREPILEKYGYRINISPDGNRLVLWHEGDYWHYNLATLEKVNITAALPVSFIKKEYDRYGYKPSYGFSGWTKDRKHVILHHKLDLWKVALDGKSPSTNLTAGITKENPIRFRLEDNRSRHKYDIEKRYLNLKSPITLTAFNTKTKHGGFYRLSEDGLKKLIYGPHTYSHYRWRRKYIEEPEKSPVLIFQKGDFNNSHESYIANRDFSNIKKVTNTNPQKSRYLWGRRVLIDYKNSTGVPLQGILSIPETWKKGQKLPMIIYSYEKMSQNLYMYPYPRIGGASISEIQYLSEGYLFLQPDIHFNIGTPHSDMLDSIKAAIEKVVELGYVDPKKIGYEGFSYGGHTGMFIATRNNPFAAIAAGAGVSNLIQGFNIDIVRDGSNEQDYYMIGQGRLGVDPATEPEIYIRESAVFGAAKMNTPLLLFHGTSDKVVQWEHSFGLYSILRFLKKPVVFLSYKGEGHGIRKKVNRLDIQTKMKQFFDHYLKGQKAPEWLEKGIPYKPVKDRSKKKKKTKIRKVPMWK